MNIQSFLQPDYALLVLRIGLAVIFFIHGKQKLAMWKMQPNQQLSGLMINILRFLSITEPLGSLAVVLGLFTQITALGFCVVMVCAIYLKITKWQKKFTGDGGWEFEFIILCAALALLLLGPGSLTL